jgi:hypothetical protein
VQEVFNPHNKPLTFKYLREEIQDFYAKYKNIQKIPLSDKLFYIRLSLSLYPESTPLKPVEIREKVL